MAWDSYDYVFCNTLLTEFIIHDLAFAESVRYPRRAFRLSDYSSVVFVAVNVDLIS
jgi:hypothetical protein